MDEDKEKTVYERTIDSNLHKAWQRFRRRGDGDTLSKALGFSRPVIDRALKHGYVKTAGLSDAISKFFSDRLEGERVEGDKLNSLMDQTANAPAA